MPHKVCIITPGTLASNPRVVKEAEALSEAGYDVHLIYTRHVGYLITADQEILDRHPEWTFDYLDWTGQGFISKAVKIFSGVKRRAVNLLLKKNLYSGKTASFLINRFYFWQLKKAISCKADLYIAHYPDSIAIAAQAARINNALFAYDAEDYHRGEDLPDGVTKIISINEDKFLHNASYISSASQLIGEAYKKLFPEVKVVAVENMFALKNQAPFINIWNDPFKFFWFSQTIGPKRGLEEFIKILGHCSCENIILTLLGTVNEQYKLTLQNLWINAGLNFPALIFLNTVPEKDIFKIASLHHFGLCLEIPSVPNKDFCMSNKLYTYLLSGNFLIMSQTKAQNNFYHTYPETGISIDLNKHEEAAAQVLKILEDQELLNAKRKKNYELGGSTLNFDREKEFLLKQVDSLWK